MTNVININTNHLTRSDLRDDLANRFSIRTAFEINEEYFSEYVEGFH